MGCSISKKELLGLAGGGGGPPKSEVVSVCGQRKRLVKSAVERRKAFADAHCKYIRSLHSVSSAIALFVSSFSAPPHPPELGLPVCEKREDVAVVDNDKDNDNDDDNDSSGTWSENSSDQGVCEFFYGDDGVDVRRQAPTPPMPSPQRGFGWDFFSLLDDDDPTKMEVVNVDDNVNDNTNNVNACEERKLKRKSVGGGGKKKGNGPNGVAGKTGIELIDALKDLEKHFVMACESGLDVSRMLEVNHHLLLLPTVTAQNQSISSSSYPLTPASSSSWLRSPVSSQSSLISSCSFNTTTTTSCSSKTHPNLNFDGCGVMESGSHSFTLGRLYAWEKKLYQEVKSGEHARNRYQQKCTQLRKQGTSDHHNELAELYNKILVVSKSADKISKQIIRMRDQELQPQLLELLHGLLRTWKAMLESHKTQSKILSQVNSFTCSDHHLFLTHSQRKATHHLESELRTWLACFSDYISAQRSYVNCIYRYLSSNPSTNGLPPSLQLLLHCCQRWFDSVQTLPDKPVKFAMKRLVDDIHATWVQMGEEQDMKRKVVSLARELERRTAALNKEESGGSSRIIMPKSPTGWIGGMIRHHRLPRPTEDRSNNKTLVAVEVMRERLLLEKERHKMSVEKTKSVTLNVLTIGFTSVFESMVHFSSEAVNLYADLVQDGDGDGDGDDQNQMVAGS